MDGISINPFINLAVAEKLSALQTYEIIAERAKGASLSSAGSSVFAAGMAGLRVKSCDSFPMPSNVLGTALEFVDLEDLKQHAVE